MNVHVHVCMWDDYSHMKSTMNGVGVAPLIRGAYPTVVGERGTYH